MTKELPELVKEVQEALSRSLWPEGDLFKGRAAETPEARWSKDYAAYETLLALWGQTVWAELVESIEDHPELMASDIGMLALALRHVKTELGPDHPDTLKFMEVLLVGNEKKLKTISFKLATLSMSKKLTEVLEEQEEETTDE